MARILVLGGTGFVGRHTARLLRERGHGVVSLGSRDADLTRPGSLQQYFGQQEIFSSDQIASSSKVTENKAPEKSAMFDFIVFASARLRAADDPVQIYDDNMAMARNVLDFMKNFVKCNAGAQAPRLIFISSVDVFGRPPEILPIREDHPYAPKDGYARSKMESEIMLHEQLGPRLLILRLPGVFGLGDGNSIAESFLKKIQSGEKISLTGSGKTKRDFIFVDSVAGCIAQACEIPSLWSQELGDAALWRSPESNSGQVLNHGRAPVPAINLVTGQTVTLREVISLLESYTGQPAQIELVDRPDFDLEFDASLCRQAFGNENLLGPQVVFQRRSRHTESCLL